LALNPLGADTVDINWVELERDSEPEVGSTLIVNGVTRDHSGHVRRDQTGDVTVEDLDPVDGDSTHILEVLQSNAQGIMQVELEMPTLVAPGSACYVAGRDFLSKCRRAKLTSTTAGSQTANLYVQSYPKAGVSVEVIYGNSQSGRINSISEHDIGVVVTDEYGNSVAGATVIFKVEAPDTSIPGNLIPATGFINAAFSPPWSGIPSYVYPVPDTFRFSWAETAQQMEVVTGYDGEAYARFYYGNLEWLWYKLSASYHAETVYFDVYANSFFWEDWPYAFARDGRYATEYAMYGQDVNAAIYCAEMWPDYGSTAGRPGGYVAYTWSTDVCNSNMRENTLVTWYLDGSSIGGSYFNENSIAPSPDINISTLIGRTVESYIEGWGFLIYPYTIEGVDEKDIEIELIGHVKKDNIALVLGQEENASPDDKALIIRVNNPLSYNVNLYAVEFPDGYSDLVKPVGRVEADGGYIVRNGLTDFIYEKPIDDSIPMKDSMGEIEAELKRINEVLSKEYITICRPGSEHFALTWLGEFGAGKICIEVSTALAEIKEEDISCGASEPLEKAYYSVTCPGLGAGFPPISFYTGIYSSTQFKSYYRDRCKLAPGPLDLWSHA